ncbi:MAG TPA: sulfotransferase [Verrucomicrobiota bacterium]|nr:hypothetical protein [Verrucomicrobiales bacterium]HRI13148.1 sulfotransferase [Verrucomicrobiota bacterium]
MSHSSIRQQAVEAVERGDLAQATELFQAAIQNQPGEVELYLELAECQWAGYEFERAIATYEEAHRVRPESVITCTQAAKKLFGIARFSESARWLERAQAFAPNDGPLLAMLAEVYERGNQLADAERCARAALDIDSAQVKSVRIMAHVERRLGRLDDARTRLHDHLMRFPGPDDWRLRYELAEVFDRLGEYAAAMNQLLLAKTQLRDRAIPYLAEAQSIRHRQRELSGLLTRTDFEAWRAASLPRERARPIAFLCGHPRSGTTLLEQILGAHEQVITTDETGVLLREFIQPILRDSPSAAESATELRSFEADQIESGRAAYWRYAEAHLGQSVGSRLLIEKDPALTPDLPLPLRLFPEARVVFPLRDPRDVCLSYFFTLVPLAAPSAAALDLRSTCEFCAHSLELWTHWKQVLPYPMLETRYERLVSDPERETQRLLEFLELPWTPAILAFHDRARSKGIRTPTYADVAQPIHQRAVGRWKNYEAFLHPHLELLRPQLRAFGYD